MSAKHTPGPWKSYIPSGFEEGFEEIAVGSIYGAVCETIDGDDWEEKCANATLIAAAPDLLAAAEELLGYIAPNRTLDHNRVGGVPGHAYDAIRAAISKAKGQL